MSTLTYKKVKDNSAFQRELSKGISEYFSLNEISRKSNKAVRLKVLLFFLIFIVLYCTPYFFQLPALIFLFVQILVGIFMILTALNVGHDAMHNAFSENNSLNYFLGLIFNLSGSNSYVWKLMHDIHHRYPNIHGYDNDISHQNIVRMSPHEKQYWFHKYQHIYVFFAALTTSLDYLFYKDFSNFYAKKIGNLEMPKHKFREHVILFLSKIIHFIIFLVLPILFFNENIWLILLGWLLLHFSGGFILFFIFTPAHLVNEVDFYNPEGKRNMETSWAEQQLLTTCNYGNTWMMNFFFGGLNYQIEHHLFPGICHIHYPKLSNIVKATANKYNLPYTEYKSYGETLQMNLQFLYKMGH